MLGNEAIIDGFSPGDCIVLDIDTTGVTPADEILRITGIDGYGRLVIYQLFRPERHASWDAASRINGITPQMVENAPLLRPNTGAVLNFLSEYKCIIGYGLKFDVKMLSASGIYLDERWRLLDVKDVYAKVAGGGFKAPLNTAAARFGYHPQNIGYEEPVMTLYVLEWLMYEAFLSGHPLEELIAHADREAEAL